MIGRTKRTDNGGDILSSPDLGNNDLERELEEYTRSAVRKIHFSVVAKSGIISLIALVFSFFLDLSTVPILGNVTTDLAKALFPAWEPAVGDFEPYRFWWLPIVTYGIFVFLAYRAYSKLKLEIIRTPASATIDRIINSYTSVIDSISTALPLIGAAILLISIKLGEEIFLGISVPFEVKALIILALGKLFEPVLDQLGVEFQNVVNHVKDIREKYFSRIQIENSKSLMKQLSQGVGGAGRGTEMSLQDMENFKSLLEQSARLSEIMHKNFSSISVLAEKVNQLDSVSTEKIQQLSALANSLNQAANSLGDDKTLSGLKSLEAIVVKK
jgi:methyl-accepting chemotaxis protein